MEIIRLASGQKRLAGRFRSSIHLHLQMIFLILVTICNKALAEDVLIINGILGQSIGLPCNLESRYTSSSSVKLLSDNEDGTQLNRPLSIDEVYGNEVSLILWYRHRSSGVPIYSIDARQQNLNDAQHQSYVDKEEISFDAHQKQFINRTINELFQNVKGRFVFNLAEQPPKLWIRKLELNDEGEYRCRVDYRGDRTKNWLVHLRVAVPPTSLYVLNSLNKELDTGRRIGPYEEQDYVSLNCVSIGGKPLPSLHWYSKENLTDTSYIVNVLEGRVENELVIGRLERKHLDQKFQCRAEINQTVLASTSVVIDLYLKPLTVNLTQIDKKLSAGHKAEFECSSSGSRPPAELVFFKDGKPIRNNGHTAESKGNVSYAKLVTILNNVDDKKTLTCRAFNSKFSKPDDYLEQSISLDVNYLPQLSVNLGSAIKRENIREGTDVYLECSVKSNPPVQEIQWTFENEPLTFDKGQGILAINHTLILQQVKKERRGNYACIARNSLGESTSQPFFLRIKYSPICRSNEPQVLMIDKNELVQLNCEFNADPTELSFSWTLNYNEHPLEDFNSLSSIGDHGRNQNGTISSANKFNNYYTKQLTLHDFVSNHSQSMLNYVVNERNTYGEVHCHASNSLGSSVHPCAYILFPHGPPCVPSNCDLKNSINEIILNCEHCDQSPPLRKGRTRNQLDNTIHMLTNSMSKSDLVYNLKVYMPINNADLIRPKTPSTEWTADQIDNTGDNSILTKNAHKQEDTGLIQVDDELKATDPMKFQGQNGHMSIGSSFNPNTALLVKNITNSVKPQFRISDLKPATVYLLFLAAVNAKGMSEVRSFSISTLGSPERQLAMDTIEQVSLNPLLLGLIAFVSIVVFFSTLILVIIRMKGSSRTNRNNLNSNGQGNNASSNSINCPNQVVNNNKVKITDKKDKGKKSKSKGKCITLQSVTKLNEYQFKDGLELRETNYGLPNKAHKKNSSAYEYQEFAQDAHGNLYTSNNHLMIATPSPAPSSCNTTSMLHTASQPIYNSSTGGSSIQLNSSYNYPPTSGFHSGNKFGTLTTNTSTNLMNQSLNNVTPLVGSTANSHLNSLNSIGGSTALVNNTSMQPSKKHVMFVGDTPPQTNPPLDGIQLLPAHTNSYLTNSYTSPLAQPIYNHDLNVADVFYGTINSTLPMKLPRLNYMSNSRINLNNSLNNQLNTAALANQQAANQQQANSMYFPVVSYRLPKEQISHANSNNGATPV